MLRINNNPEVSTDCDNYYVLVIEEHSIDPEDCVCAHENEPDLDEVKMVLE